MWRRCSLVNNLALLSYSTSDLEGETAAKGLIRKWITNDRHVLLIGEVLGHKEATLEDIFRR